MYFSYTIYTAACFLCFAQSTDASDLRETTGYIRTFDKNNPSSYQQVKDDIPGYDKIFKSVMDSPPGDTTTTEKNMQTELQKEQSDFNAFMQALNGQDMSMKTSSSPTSHPTLAPSKQTSAMPSAWDPLRAPTDTVFDPSTDAPTLSAATNSPVQVSQPPNGPPSRFPTTSPSMSASLTPSLMRGDSTNAFPSIVPTIKPSNRVPSLTPTVTPSTMLSSLPSVTHSAVYPSAEPTIKPTTRFPSISPTVTPSTTLSSSPSVTHSAFPSKSASASPSVTQSDSPTGYPSVEPTIKPTTRFPSISPTMTPSTTLSSSPSVTHSASPSSIPTQVPTEEPSASPTTSVPSTTPTIIPTKSPSSIPSKIPSASPTLSPSQIPSTSTPTGAPTYGGCGITAESRNAQILAQLFAVSDPALIRDLGTPQGKATYWLLNEDELRLCPDHPKLVQRWVMAVIYFSTNGDEWLHCSGNVSATDLCGSEVPFVGRNRFLSNTSECMWAGIGCMNGCVTEIQFEDNNLNGTIPSEIGLLSELAIWGMGRGGLTSSIPSTIGLLTNLIVLDLDFNELTGSLSSELLSLTSLLQLDINNNHFTGSIDGLGVFPNMTFLQIHANFFTGTVPSAIGTYSALGAFTLQHTAISGTMPQSVCDLLVTAGNGGVLTALIADCGGNYPNIVCHCCTDCRKVKALYSLF